MSIGADPADKKSIIETTDNLDDLKILAYHEGIRATFIVKFILLMSALKEKAGRHVISVEHIPENLLTGVLENFPDEKLIVDAFRLENSELFEYIMDDISTGALNGAWVVFEQTTKAIPNPNYSHEEGEESVNYHNKAFGLSKEEKKNCDLFYYLRNSLQHHNGAYYASKAIDHSFRGVHFQSKGNEGQKMPMNAKLAYEICKELERLTYKAWNSHKNVTKMTQA